MGQNMKQLRGKERQGMPTADAPLLSSARYGLKGKREGVAPAAT